MSPRRRRVGGASLDEDLTGAGDGVGDLPGITSRLSYLRDLGVDAGLGEQRRVAQGPVQRARQHAREVDAALLEAAQLLDVGVHGVRLGHRRPGGGGVGVGGSGRAGGPDPRGSGPPEPWANGAPWGFAVPGRHPVRCH